jgi:tRNA(Ile)-lysidine synthase
MLPLQSFRSFISQHQLFKPGQRILLAVSGGKDSVLMVHLFKLAQIDFGIAHCNFNLRAEESQRDEAFVRSLAENLEVPFYVSHFDTKAYAKINRCSTQMAARDLRYRWFEEVRVAAGYDLVALAHHQNDAMETLLINLTRGTGISGLHGIAPKREKLIRPLLFLTRSDIEQIINREKIDYVEDSSNLSDHYARNKIRLNIIPQLQSINPNLEHTFFQNIQRFQDAEAIIQLSVDGIREKIVRETNRGVLIALQDIKVLQPQKLLTYELLKPYGFSESLVLEVLQALAKQSGTSFYSNTHRITLNRQDLLITPIAENSITNLLIHPSDEIIQLRHAVIHIHYTQGNDFSSDGRAYADAEKLIFPLVVRSRQPGDVFMPMGMKTFKKLSNFLVDEKVPLPEKDKIPLIINGDGAIIWVAGMRQDDRFKVQPTTKKVAIFELKLKQ